MRPTFRPISTISVMCTVQACENAASFIFNGLSEASAGKRAVVAALCDAHAEEIAERLGCGLPEARRHARWPHRTGLAPSG
jgi:hypothetical protein